MNAKTFADNFRTPHTDKLHVIERIRLIEGGKKLEIHVTVEDPDTFEKPWQGVRRYDPYHNDRGEAEEDHVGMAEDICQEGNFVGARNNLASTDYRVPTADKADF